jgi:hypothetical protein
MTGRHRMIGQVRCGVPQVEGGQRGDLDTALDRARIAREPSMLLRRTAEMRER